MIEKPFILLSVIIPIYNVDKYLRKCLTTCLSHNNAIEYILVDDGSTDDSLKIAKDYIKAYKNIVVIHQKNMGLSAARNTGLKSAIGKWIYFIDSDDFVSENYIDNMYNLLKKVDSKINLINLPVKKFINGKEIEIQNGNNELVKSMNFAESILNDDRQMGVWSYVFKNRYLKKKKILFKEGFLFEDQYYMPPIICDQDNVYEVSSDLIGYYYYRTRKNSISLSKPTLKKVIDKVNAEMYKNNYFYNYYKNSPVIIKSAKSSMLSTYFTGLMGSIYLNDYSLQQKYLINFRRIQRQINWKLDLKQKIKIILTYLPGKTSSFFYYRLDAILKNLKMNLKQR